MTKKYQKAFTLIELLVVISIIATLAAVVFVALDPAKRLKDARDSRRWNDVNTLLTAMHQYIVDTGGSMPPGVTSTASQLGTCASGGATNCTGAGTACLDIGGTLVKYLKSVPVDPKGSAASTGYSVVKDTNNILTINACLSEGTTISVSR
ncbi:MAG: type II secretion system protein [Candidatus Shapirobacteria bacterium]|jgi:prepilin-type N-terminal cleavage/methylation domain-containing protein